MPGFLKVLLKLLIILLTICLVALFLSGVFGYLTWGEVFMYLFKGVWVLVGLIVIWAVTVMVNITGRDKDV